MDLQIITYSTKRHVDADTLSRIRSHAQHHVQSQRGRGKGARVRGPSVHARNIAVAKGGMTTFCNTLDFGSCKDPPKKTKSAKRAKKPKVVEQEEDLNICVAPIAIVKSPGAAFEPFDAFPVVLDSDFLSLFERYHRAWKWKQSKADLFQETVSNATLCHSWLAIANSLLRNKEVRAIEHEIKTIDIVYAGLEKLPTLSDIDRPSEALSLTWAILRLALIKAGQGDLDEVVNHLNALATIAPSRDFIERAKFGDHIQCQIAILLLFNIGQMDRVDAVMRYPYGSYETSAMEEVEALGLMLPASCPLVQSSLGSLINEKVLDALKALTALCQTLPTFDSPSSYHPVVHNKRQAIGCMKIGFRLGNFDNDMQDHLHGPKTWQDQLEGCLTLSALIFIWCFDRRKDATPTAISHVRDEVRQRLTPELICRAVREVGKSQPLIDLMLWMLIVCGSAAATQDDKMYYSGLIRILAPKFLDRSFEELESWGRQMPWIRGHYNSPVEEFWCLTTGRATSNLTKRAAYLDLLGQERERCPSIFR
ncbi:hypothetical protein PRZ48_004045 [Zasmidium cellare]|uniref:Tachykinin family protein n=1 Tax=Zasmidium cellare TaxID=395010 RepID=A0ABR0EY04_ZASCE|nr:hypothetical protein PRZ48_004045 [Zasmidium cellare]